MARKKRLRLSEYVEVVQPQVRSCSYCQPYEGGVVWVIGDQTALDTLLDENDVPDDMRDDVAACLTCPGCGNEGFQRYDDIGVHTVEELEDERRWNEWYAKWQPQLDDFAGYLRKYPYLGAKHRMGRKILRSIGEFSVSTISDEVWWRARKPNESKAMSIGDMVAPPAAAAKSEGRFNHYGQVVLYLASNPTGALAEVLDRNAGECIAWVQEFALANVAEIIDLTAPEPWKLDNRSLLTVGLDHNLKQWIPDPESPWKPEYFVPRFIADAAREAGRGGIVFESHKHYEKNLVLFNAAHPGVKPQGQPKLLVVSNAKEKGRVGEIEPWEPEF